MVRSVFHLIANLLSRFLTRLTLSLQGSAVLFPFPLLSPALILSLAFSIHLDLCLLPSHGPDKHNCQAFSAWSFFVLSLKGVFRHQNNLCLNSHRLNVSQKACFCQQN